MAVSVQLVSFINTICQNMQQSNITSYTGLLPSVCEGKTQPVELTYRQTEMICFASLKTCPSFKADQLNPVSFWKQAGADAALVIDDITAVASAAAAAAVSAGTSLEGATLSDLMGDYTVACGIEIENWTKFPLSHPNVRPEAGAIKTPPRAILPSQREAMVARKTSYAPTGTYGTVSWLVERLNRRIVVMWSAPFDFTYHSNWLGLGITTHGYTGHNINWFKQMYYNSSATSLGFKRKEYHWNLDTLVYKGDTIEILGTMGSSHKAKVKLTVRPVNEKDLADAITSLLNK